jgi:hypothetical protein
MSRLCSSARIGKVSQEVYTSGALLQSGGVWGGTADTTAPVTPSTSPLYPVSDKGNMIIVYKLLKFMSVLSFSQK